MCSLNKFHFYFSIFLIFVYANFSFSQKNDSYYAYYSVEFNAKERDSTMKYKNIGVIEECVKLFKFIEYELYINESKSLYKQVKSLELKNETYMNIAKKIAGNSEIYIDLQKKKKISKKDFAGDTFVIKDSIHNNWNITNEKKYIGGYLCYKATFKTVNFQYPNGLNVTAWFTNEIPLAHGPKGYGGLPGLIIEISENRLKYKLKKVIKSNTSKKINKPSNGIEMSYEDYLKYIKQKVTELKF